MTKALWYKDKLKAIASLIADDIIQILKQREMGGDVNFDNPVYGKRPGCPEVLIYGLRDRGTKVVFDNSGKDDEMMLSEFDAQTVLDILWHVEEYFYSIY